MRAEEPIRILDTATAWDDILQTLHGDDRFVTVQESVKAIEKIFNEHRHVFKRQANASGQKCWNVKQNLGASHQ